MATNWKDIRKTLEPERETRIKDRVREEVARQEREDREPEYDDEPRIDGKSALDLFRESCKAADAERRKRWPDGIIPCEEVERETQERFRREWKSTVTDRFVSVTR